MNTLSKPSPELLFPTFDGDPLNYLPFIQKVLHFLEAYSKFCVQGMGLRGFMDNPADFLLPERPGGLPAGPFVPRPHPGPKPILQNNPTAAQRLTYKHRIALWKDAMEEFIGENQLLSAVKIMLCNAVPEHCLSAIKDPIQGFRNLTLLAIRVHLNVEFLILSPVDLSNNLASLLTAYSPSVPIAKHIGLHRDVAAIQAANNSPIPETRRFWYIVESIRPCGLYDMMITAYTLINTTAATQLFATFVVQLVAFEKNRRPSVTAKAAGYAAAALLGPPGAAPLALPAPAPVHPDPSIAQLIADSAQANAAIASIQSLLQGQYSGGGGGGAGKGKNKKGKNKNSLYCWTHGCLGHASPACLNKLPGHMDAATYTNQLGGKKA